MAGIAITRRELSATELRAAAGKTKDSRGARRMLAIRVSVLVKPLSASICGHF